MLFQIKKKNIYFRERRIIKLFAIIIILSVACNNSKNEPNEKLNEVQRFLYYFCLFTTQTVPAVNKVVTDKMNGSIEIATITTYPTRNQLCGGGTSGPNSTTRILFKKCLQGQIYRQAQNDCQGTGTAANNFGAQTFQWCPTNGFACNQSTNSSPPNENSSPAAITCRDDTFLQRRWYLFDASKEEIFKTAQASSFTSFYNSVSTWNASSGFTNSNFADIYNFTSNPPYFVTITEGLKNSFNNVLCYTTN